MKSGVEKWKLCVFEDFIFMFLGLDPVLYIWGHLFIVYITFTRLIVLYSRCRVNRTTNLSVVLYDVIYFCFASTVVWAPYRHSQPVGCVPTVAASTP